jgi:hypothetical protein
MKPIPRTGGPAFPCDVYDGNTNKNIVSTGATLRDYFAKEAMGSFIKAAPSGSRFGVDHEQTNLSYAHAAYALADAMLIAREVAA